MDPRCHIQYLYWYHEPPNREKILIKTARNTSDPYIHTIDNAYEEHHGRYERVLNYKVLH